MTNPLDPYNWGDYPSRSELAFDTCTNGGCPSSNHMPHSTRCWWHSNDTERAVIQSEWTREPTHDEQVQAAVDAEDSRLADADWGTET